MSYNYNVTAFKSTAVSHSLAGHFTSPDVLNVLLGKGNHIEIHAVSPEGLKPLLDIPLYGSISYMELFRTNNDPKDRLFVLTQRYHIAVLSYEEKSEDVLTKAFGSVKERVGRPTEGPPLCAIDPTCSVVGLILYMGTMKFVPLSLDKGDELVSFSTRLPDIYVIAMCFLTGYDQPTICYIAETPKGRLLRSFTVVVKDRELVEGPWKVDSIDSQACFMFPLPQPAGGVVCVAETTIIWYNKNVLKAMDPPQLKDAMLSCYGRVDDQRYLLGDMNGYLYMVFLTVEEGMNDQAAVTDLKMELLGEVSSVKSVTYLDNGVLFVGSCWGDSQLVKLCTEPTPDSKDSCAQILESFTNLGPIVDMVLVDLDKQDHDQVVTCSGYGKDGSLRVVRSGIGIQEVASVDLPGIKGIWTVSTAAAAEGSNDIIVISFIAQTTVLSISGEELEATEVEGIVQGEETFACGNVHHKQILQITSSSVRLVNSTTLQLSSEWRPSSLKKISACAFNSCQVVVAMGNDIQYLEIGQELINEISTVSMPHEVSCLDVHPLTTGGGVKSSGGGAKVPAGGSEVCAVGLWQDITVRILGLPSFVELHREQLGGEIIPRSISMVTMEDVSYLLVALGDGCLLYYTIDKSGNVSGRKRVVLGTKPVELKPFVSTTEGMLSVFACSDRPTIIYSNSRKLLFSSINLKEVNHMATLNCEAYPQSLLLALEDSFIIGAVDQIQKLHVRTVPLSETPRRIAHLGPAHCFAVLTVRPAAGRHCASLNALSKSLAPAAGHAPPPKVGAATTVSSILILDEGKFEVVHCCELLPFENGCSVMSMTLRGKEVFVVGTAFVYPTDKDPEHGRVLVFEWKGGKLSPLYCKEVAGPVHSLTTVGGGEKIVATKFSSVLVLRVRDEQLEEECSFPGCILAIFLKSKGDFILVGDLLRSFYLLSYKEDRLEQIALDTNLSPSYMTAVEMIDDDCFVGADSQHLFTCQKNTDASCEADAAYMVQTARFSIGDTANVFRQGSLVMAHGTGHLLTGPVTLYGTIHGAIGILGQVSEDLFNKLGPVESSLRNVIKSVGNIDYETHRCFTSEHRSKPTAGFLDGDVLERLIDLPRDKVDEVAMGIKVPPGKGEDPKPASIDEILKIIEDLTRLH